MADEVRREADEAPAAEQITRGLVRTWLALKIMPLVVALTRLLLGLALIASYAVVIAWKVRRMIRGGALDDEGSPAERPSVVAKERGVLAWIRGSSPLTSDALPL